MFSCFKAFTSIARRVNVQALSYEWGGYDGELSIQSVAPRERPPRGELNETGFLDAVKPGAPRSCDKLHRWYTYLNDVPSS